MKKKFLVFLIIALLTLVAGLTGCSGSKTEAPQNSGENQSSEAKSEPKSEPVTLKVATAWAEKGTFNDGFWMFYDKINKANKANLKLEWVGGPEAIPAFELIEAVKNGVVDAANIAGAYYVPQMPEADIFKLSQLTPQEERQKGFYDEMNKLHQEKVNAYYLGWSSPNIKYHLYLNKEVKTPDLKGQSIRVTPIYKALVSALGGAPVTIAPGEVYTALERGVVQGYGWPSIGISDFGWEEVTKYMVEPGFYQTDVVILVNKDKWEKLSPEQQNLLKETMIETEKEAAAHYDEKAVKDREKNAEKGVKIIEFSPEDAEKYLSTAYEAGWDEFLKASAANGPKLKEFLNK